MSLFDNNNNFEENFIFLIKDKREVVLFSNNILEISPFFY